MTFELTPTAGFNWAQVAWGAPDEVRRENCSYCDSPLGEDEMPLILWRKGDGWCAEFCTTCQSRWWGFQSFGDDPRDTLDDGVTPE